MTPMPCSLKELCHFETHCNLTLMESHGASVSLFFDLNKDIIYILIGEIMFKNFWDKDHNGDENFIEGDKAEHISIFSKIHGDAVTAKKPEMRVFKLQASEPNDEVDIYIVKITNTKATVFQIMPCYVACGTSFRMTANLIVAAYYVLASPSLRACGDNLMAIYISVQSAANFQRILDLL